MPLKARDDLYTSILIGLHHFAQLFRIKLGGEGSRADHVTEHDRQLPPFGFTRAPYDSPRGNWQGWSCGLLSLGRGRQSLLPEWLPTLTTKLKMGGILCPTARTPIDKRRAALTAELHSPGILKPTARTAHAASLPLRPAEGKEKAGCLTAGRNRSRCYFRSSCYSAHSA